MLIRIVFRNNETKIIYLIYLFISYLFLLRPSTCWELGIQTYNPFFNLKKSSSHLTRDTTAWGPWVARGLSRPGPTGGLKE